MATPADLKALAYLKARVSEYQLSIVSESVFVFLQNTHSPVPGEWRQYSKHPVLAKPIEIIALLREICKHETTNDFVSSRCGDVMSPETIRVMVAILDIYCSTLVDSADLDDNLVRVDSDDSADLDDNLVRVDSDDSDDNLVRVDSVKSDDSDASADSDDSDASADSDASDSDYAWVELEGGCVSAP